MTNSQLDMINFVLIANPQSRRVDLFQQALRGCGLSMAQLVSYEELLAEKDSLTDWDGSNAWFRFEAPERNFVVDRGFVATGAVVDDSGNHQRISATAAYQLPEDKGRILYPRQWYLGWRHCLQSWTQPLQGQVMNHPDNIVSMFDKIRCQRTLENADIPIPCSLVRKEPIQDYDQLKDRMAQQGCQRVFVKLAHGSSASGVVAYEYRGDNERAITTVERTMEQGELRFYNSRKVYQYRNPQHIAEIINFLAKETIQVEAWMPKARIEGREFDLRVVVIGGEAKHVVVRVGKSPMTNLHLSSDRKSITDLPSALTADNWATMMHTCEQAAACFPKSLYCGIDLLIAPNFKDHYVLEVNAFGDLLRGITWQGQDTYTTEIKTLLQQHQGLPYVHASSTHQTER
ncbi:glutathione synthase/ribosomal protein S6 modification enzyme (glutaminyl transferase) [Leptolyngbya sp. PCC 7375]|nr:glutathione synthase/ribosomal protein S6 modification enzyme (glutaminyl transferase) [Leptolyngbya sp. PCC 7375]